MFCLYYNLQEINGEVYEVIGRQGLVVSFHNLLVAVNAVVVEHIQEQLLTENPKTSQKQEKISLLSVMGIESSSYMKYLRRNSRDRERWLVPVFVGDVLDHDSRSRISADGFIHGVFIEQEIRVGLLLVVPRRESTGGLLRLRWPSEIPPRSTAISSFSFIFHRCCLTEVGFFLVLEDVLRNVRWMVLIHVSSVMGGV